MQRMQTQRSCFLTEMDVYGMVLNQGFLVFLLGQCLKIAKDETFIGDLASILAKGGRADREHINSCSDCIATAEREEDADVNRAVVQLTWPLRMSIARQVAEALVYLHHENKPPLSHRNIQGSSILLNQNFEVRLGSLSDGERLENGELPAYDMYCYGKLLLDLLSGLDITGDSRSQQAQAWMANCFPALIVVPLLPPCVGHTSGGSATTSSHDVVRRPLLHSCLIDKNLLPLEERHLAEMVQVAKLAKLCMEPTTLQRSSMKGVLDLLTLALNLHGVVPPV